MKCLYIYEWSDILVLKGYSKEHIFVVLFDVLYWTIDRYGMYLYSYVFSFLALFFSFSHFFLVCNVEVFLTSGYMDKKFIVFFHASLPSKTYWTNVISVVGDYSQFSSLLCSFVFYNIPNQ